MPSVLCPVAEGPVSNSSFTNVNAPTMARWFTVPVPSCEAVFFAETFRSFFAETFWSLTYFDHLSHSCVKTHHKIFFSLYFQTF